jgi:hypothetical protein
MIKNKLLITSIIALLAFPARAEIVRLFCAPVTKSVGGNNLILDVNMDNFFSIIYGTQERWLRLLSRSDNHVAWTWEKEGWGEVENHTVITYLLNRKTLVLSIGSVALEYIDLSETMDGLGRASYFQCAQPL